MNTLFKYFKCTEGPCEASSLIVNDIIKANECVAKALKVKGWPAKYNNYTPGQRALLGKYATEHGAKAAAIHYSKAI